MHYDSCHSCINQHASIACTLRFHAIIDCIRANGMEPMCTLHHFTHPPWFEEMGGFTKEENIPIFVSPEGPSAGREGAFIPHLPWGSLYTVRAPPFQSS